MSHFAVLVLHKEDQNIDDLLAPYDENLKVEPYLKFTKEQAIKYAEKWADEDELPNMSEEDKLEYVEQCGYIRDDNDNFLTTYNPESHWDWYQVGGRWNGNLRLIDKNLMDGYSVNNLNVNSAFVRHIKWINPLTPEEEKEYKRWWEVRIEGAPLEEGEDVDICFWNPEYFKRRYKDIETYLKIQTLPCYHAVITPDGKWHQQSQMLMFACTDGTLEDELDWDLHFKERFIDTADFDTVATIVDCHI